jgi:hypothetical protein
MKYFNTETTLVHCPACGRKSSQEELKVLGGGDGSVLIHLTCAKCWAASLAVTSRDDHNNQVMTVGMLTDLNREEALDLLSKKALSVDEVLDLYQVLV